MPMYLATVLFNGLVFAVRPRFRFRFLFFSYLFRLLMARWLV